MVLHKCHAANSEVLTGFRSFYKKGSKLDVDLQHAQQHEYSRLSMLLTTYIKLVFRVDNIHAWIEK